MRSRAILACVVGAAIIAPAASSAHTVRKACHGRDRVITTHHVEAGTMYIDDRGFFGSPDTDPIYDTIGRDKRVPTLSRRSDPSGYWVYLETNRHPGLQTGGDHAVLGENGEQTGSNDPCRATHRKTRRSRATWGYDSILF